MQFPHCNGIKIKALNQDAGHVAVQSSMETTFMLVRRITNKSKAQYMEKAISPNEVVHIKAQSESACAEIEIVPLGDSAATLVCQSNRTGSKVLRVGGKYTFAMRAGEALVMYSPTIRHPYESTGAGLNG